MKSLGIKVAVLRGGPSGHYDASLKTGEYVLSALRELPQYHPIDIFISKSGEWHRDGLVEEPHRSLRYVDVVWNALHGPYGEDGQVQRLLESMKIPFTGSGTVASALALNKDMAKNLYRNHFLRSPAHETLTQNSLSEAKVVEIFRTYMHPVVVRPANAKENSNVRLAHSFNELKGAIKETFYLSPRVLVEERVEGEAASCAVLENYKGERLFSLPISVGMPVVHTEFKKRKNKLSKEAAQTIGDMAKRAHGVLGLRHYSNSNFIVSPRGRVYIIETQSAPEFQPASHLYRSLEPAGWRRHDFVDHILKLALPR